MRKDERVDDVPIEHLDPMYHSTLSRHLAHLAPTRLTALGNLDLLRQNKVALFCSIKCPGDLILQTYDLALQLRSAGITVISGFHSPMERECLRILLRGTQPVILCPGRSIVGMRVSPELKKALGQRRLLILSPFPDKVRRATAGAARVRNQLVAALADHVFVAYAAPSGKTEQFCREVIAWKKPLYTFASRDNANLIDLGAKPLSPDHVLRWACSP